jgi:tropomodulin
MSKLTAMEDDDDFLLSQLTAEQIAELSDMIDPDNTLLPASDRLPPQTAKKPTGPYDRQHLLEHLRKEAKASKVGDDYLPFIRKIKEEKKELKEQKKMENSSKIYLSEFDDILAELNETEIIELASELGLHGLVTQEQSRGDSHASSIPSYSHQKLEKLLSNKGGGDEEEPIDLEDLMQRIDDDDPTLVDLNLNNHPLISSQQIYQLIEALQNNTHITKLSLTNIKFDDHHAAELAKLLCNNDHWITLNLDSNRLANDGIRVRLSCHLILYQQLATLSGLLLS